MSQLNISHDSIVTLYIPDKIGIIKGSNPVSIIYVGILSFFFTDVSFQNVSRETFCFTAYINYIT